MKPLKAEDLEGKTWGEIVRYYKPDATDEEIDFILYEKNLFPNVN